MKRNIPAEVAAYRSREKEFAAYCSKKRKALLSKRGNASTHC